MNCRHCKEVLNYTFLDLGFAPPSNAYLQKDDLNKHEVYLPLKVKVCEKCWLVQTEDYTESENLFTHDYAYFSSTSSSFLLHAENYVNNIIKKLKLDQNSLVIEVASNDGYLLKNFVRSNIPCLGIEPTDTAETAKKMGIPIIKEFFSENLGNKIARENKKADLIIGNNVYAHVPDINDFTKGLKAALKHNGTITLEFPHLMVLIDQQMFDTIYHEHFSYLSLHAVVKIFAEAGLRVWNVEKISTHGGSLRVYGCHVDDSRSTNQSVVKLLTEEDDKGLRELKTYLNFQVLTDKIKNDLLSFLIEQKRLKKKVLAYGAAAKGSTILNYAGIKSDLIKFVVDSSEAKQDKFMPGSHIPILHPEELIKNNPDYVLVFPWNLADEIKAENLLLIKNGTKFFIAIPKLKII